ncbi:MAG: IclR family transcriptional regulator [Actinomycetota bacterium]|nr:IclR family transcriptional regulator [Actinomycetota bacterium]
MDRAVAVLDVLAQAQSDLGTNEIARRTGINVSSVSRLLATLARKGLVVQVTETGRYRLGLRLLELGNAALSRVDLRDVARPHLRELATFTGETATLSVPGEVEAITMDFVESLSSVQSVARLGRPSVAHATAIGKVFLAYGGRLPDGPLIAHTERTITNRRKLAEVVARTVEQGWAQAVCEREADLNALAAPIIAMQGELKGILGVQGPAGRFGRQAMRSALKSLLSSAHAISRSWPG